MRSSCPIKGRLNIKEEEKLDANQLPRRPLCLLAVARHPVRYFLSLKYTFAGSSSLYRVLHVRILLLDGALVDPSFFLSRTPSAGEPKLHSLCLLSWPYHVLPYSVILIFVFLCTQSRLYVAIPRWRRVNFWLTFQRQNGSGARYIYVYVRLITSGSRANHTRPNAARTSVG